MFPNPKRLTVVLLTLILSAAGIFAAHRLQQGHRVEAMQRNLERARQGNDPRALITALKRYLAIRPDDQTAKAELLNLLAANAVADADVYDVYNQYREFVQRYPEDVVHRERMISMALRLGEHKEVLSNLDFLASRIKLTPQMLIWKAISLQKQGDIEGAIRSYESALELDPGQLEAYISLATIFRRNLDAVESAQYWVRRLTEENPESAQAFLYQARYYVDVIDLPAALKSVEAAMRLNEASSEAVLLWSDIVMLTRQRETEISDRTWKERDVEISQRLQKAWEADPGNAQFASKLAALALRKNQPDEAERILRQGLKQAPDDALLRWELADLAISRDRIEEAQKLISEMTAARVKRGLTDYLRGRLLLKENQWHEASGCFLRARDDMAESPRLSAQADMYLADCYAGLGDSDQRLTAARRAVQIQPFFVAARQYLSQALLAVGRVDEALAEYRTMLELPDAPAYGWTRDVGWATVAKVLIIRNLSKPASERDWEDLEPVLQSLAAEAPDSIEVTLLRSEVLASQSRVAESRDLLQTHQAEGAKDVRWWVALINLALREDDLPAAEKLLQEGQQELGGQVELSLLDARMAVYRREDGQARLAEIAQEAVDWPVKDRVRLLYELAALHLSLGQLEEVQAMFDQIVALTPQDIRVWLSMFDAAMNREDFDACRNCVAAMGKIEGRDGAYTMLAESFLILRSEMSGKDTLRREAARSSLTTLQVRRPRWARVPWALGMLDELDGRREHAAENYLRAFDLGDRSPELVRRTLNLLHGLHRYDLAEDLIHRWEQTPNAPILPEINRMAAEISLEQQNPQQALMRAQRAVSKNSSSYEDHLWLAQIHRSGGEPDEAEAEFRTAVSLAPQAGEAWVALTRHLLARQRTDEAQAIVERIRAEAPVDRQPSILAACLEVLGDFPSAEREYERAVAENPADLKLLYDAAEFFRRARKNKESERLWRRLLELSASRPALERCSARRGLASVLALRGDYAAFLESLALVEQNLKELPRSTLDLRAKSTLMAMRGDPQQRRESAELFTRLAREEPLTTRDQSLLATLYELNGDLNRAHEAWQKLVASQNTNPTYLARYVSVLLKRNAKSDALVWLERLQEVAPNWRPTLELQAEYWLQEGRVDNILEMFQNHVARAEDDQQRARRSIEAGEALERLSRTYLRAYPEQLAPMMEAAEKLFRQYAELDPTKKHVLAGFLARTARAEEALELFEQSWDSVPPAVISSLIASSLPLGDADPKLAAQAAAAIASRMPTPVVSSMLNDLAVLEELQQHFDAAEKHYRAVLAQEPDNIVAMNNLAFLLALQNRKLEEAAQLIEKAFSISGPSPALLDTRAQVALAQGNLEAARSDREAVARETPSPAAWLRLAIVYERMKDGRKLREAATKARNSGVKEGDLHFLERRFIDPVLKTLDEAA